MKNKAERELKYVIAEIRRLLNGNDASYSSFTSSEQLLDFIKEFESALANVINNSMPPQNERSLGIARVIIDQWPFDFELGKIIISAEQAYKDV